MGETFGVMLDCSRNGVMKVDKVKEFARMIADMGYNMLQLYTEDTYEIKGEPFFGHLRGRYSQEELKELDAYCNTIGVELVPCIQTLAHLNQLKQWEPYGLLFDDADIILTGSDEVYQLIDKMFQTLEECFTSRRVNVGMDEAYSLGRGRYLDLHGYRESREILREHLMKVKEIADKHGFSIMMWGDMFLHQYEDCIKKGELPQDVLNSVPEGTTIMYWDYDTKETAKYDETFEKYFKFNRPVGYASGIKTWIGYAPNLTLSLDAHEAAYRSIQGKPVDNVLVTIWGNDGKECSFYSAIPVLFAASRMIKGNFDRTDIARQFEEMYGYSFEEFLNLELPNMTNEERSHMCNPSKYLLYNDVFLGLFDTTITDELANRYAKAAEILANSIDGRKYDYIFDTIYKLLNVLKIKCDLGVRLRRAYQTGNKKMLQKILEYDFPVMHRNLILFFDAARKQWLEENKVFGLEVQEQRFGALLYRTENCEQRLASYLSGELDCIEELEEESLVRVTGHGRRDIQLLDWRDMITANIV